MQVVLLEKGAASALVDLRTKLVDQRTMSQKARPGAAASSKPASSEEETAAMLTELQNAAALSKVPVQAKAGVILTARGPQQQQKQSRPPSQAAFSSLLAGQQPTAASSHRSSQGHADAAPQSKYKKTSTANSAHMTGRLASNLVPLTADLVNLPQRMPSAPGVPSSLGQQHAVLPTAHGGTSALTISQALCVDQKHSSELSNKSVLRVAEDKMHVVPAEGFAALEKPANQTQPSQLLRACKRLESDITTGDIKLDADIRFPNSYLKLEGEEIMYKNRVMAHKMHNQHSSEYFRSPELEPSMDVKDRQDLIASLAFENRPAMLELIRLNQQRSQQHAASSANMDLGQSPKSGHQTRRPGPFGESCPCIKRVYVASQCSYCH